MTVSTTGARHLLLRLGPPARLPNALLTVLRDEVVLAGWMRASGVLSEVQLRVGAAAPRRIAGPLQVISLEGSIGLAGGDVSCGLRAVLVRETESGLETIAGDLVEARVDALEVLVTAFDEVTATRQQDQAGVWVLDVSENAARAVAPAAPSSSGAAARSEEMRRAVTSPAPPTSSTPAAVITASPLQSGFAEAVRASEMEAVPPAPRPAPVPPAAAAIPPPAPRPSPTFSAGNMSNTMPQRIARPVQAETEDDPVPEPGDVVEHFAFGRCEVVKTEGDRLHVRLGKDQRIKEIALEMLKVTPLPPEEGQSARHFKLARKM